VNLYGFVGNAPIFALDRLGLWKIHRVGTKRWADAISEDGDTLRGLAAEAGLGEMEIDRWARVPIDYPTYDLDFFWPKGCVVEVPNVFAYYVSDPDLLGSEFIFAIKEFQNQNGPLGGVRRARRYLLETIAEFEKEGFFMQGTLSGSSQADFETLWKEDGIWGIAFAGHGVKDGALNFGFAAWDDGSGDPDTIGPNNVSPPYGLAFIDAHTCYSADPIVALNIENGTIYQTFWVSLVSTNGRFRGWHGNLTWCSGPPVWSFRVPTVSKKRR
jgi:hypothetical protein